MKRYAFFDIDHTLYNGYSINDFCRYFFANGHISEKFIKDQQHFETLYKEKKISYKEVAWEITRCFAETVKGKPIEEVEMWSDKYVHTSPQFFHT